MVRFLSHVGNGQRTLQNAGARRGLARKRQLHQHRWGVVIVAIQLKPCEMSRPRLGCQPRHTGPYFGVLSFDANVAKYASEAFHSSGVGRFSEEMEVEMG